MALQSNNRMHDPKGQENKIYTIVKCRENFGRCHTTIVSEYDQEIPQSQAADKPITPRGRATQQLRDTRKTN